MSFTAYRIQELHSGYGPYHGDTDIFMLTDIPFVSYDNALPNIKSDLPDEFIPFLTKYLSGCDSIHKLRDWFGPHVEILLQNGYAIYEFELKDMVPGKSLKQIFFTKENIISQSIIQTY